MDGPTPGVSDPESQSEYSRCRQLRRMATTFGRLCGIALRVVDSYPNFTSRSFRHSKPFSQILLSYRQNTMCTVTSTERIHDSTDKERKTHCILSWYIFTEQPVEHARNAVYEALSRIGALGRVYVATEGINAQVLLKPSTSLWREWDRLRTGDDSLRALLPDPDVMHDKSESGVWLTEEECDTSPPFRRLDVRTRSHVLSNDNSSGSDLDMNNHGMPLAPEQWAERMSQKNPPPCIDVRNHYESDIGHFRGAIKPNTMNNRDMNGELEKISGDLDKTEPLLIYCTGGIRCVKAGAFLKQRLGFQQVFYLDGGIDKYAHWSQNAGKDKASVFDGLNFVFNERMCELVENSSPELPPSAYDHRRAREAVHRLNERLPPHRRAGGHPEGLGYDKAPLCASDRTDRYCVDMTGGLGLDADGADKCDDGADKCDDGADKCADGADKCDDGNDRG